MNEVIECEAIFSLQRASLARFVARSRKCRFETLYRADDFERVICVTFNWRNLSGYCAKV